MLNFFVSNFLMCFVCLFIILYCVFFLDVDNIGLCLYYGYIIYSIVGMVVLNIVFIFFNCYFFIVRFSLYYRIYIVRNIRIIFVVVWMFYFIVLVFFLINIWGMFIYDNLRFMCNFLYFNSSFWVFVLVIIVIIIVLIILFCYVEILRKVNLSFCWVVSVYSGVV